MACSHEGGLFVAHFVFKDEALSHPAWIHNSQNSRIRSAENPQALHENPLLSSKMGVWCALYKKGVVGPFLFQGTVTVENYPSLLTQFVVLLEENKWNCCFIKFG